LVAAKPTPQFFSDLIVDLSAKGEILSWSPIAESFTGYATEEIIGRGIDAIIADPVPPEARKAIASLRDGNAVIFETLLRRKDGTLVQIEVDANARANRQGPAAAIIRDLTESRRARRVRQQNAERLRLALSAAEIGTYEIDLLTQCYSLDLRAAAIWGRDPSEKVCYESLAAQALDEDRPSAEASLVAAADPRGDGGYALEFRIRRRNDGAMRWVALQGRTFFEGGRAISRVGVMLDITDKRNAQEDLRRREEFMRWIVQDAPIPIMLKTVDGRIINVNRRFTEESGYSLQDFQFERDWFTRVRRLPPQAADEQLEITRKRAASREKCPPEEMSVWIKSGEERLWLVYRSAPFVSPEGVEIVVSAALDVTERKRAEEANAHLAAIIGASDDAIYSLTLEGIVLSWNAAAERVFGAKADAMIGCSDLLLVPDELRAERDALFAAAKTGAVIRRETRRLRRDGATIDVLLSIAPMRASSGEITAISVLARDITADNRILAELKRAHAKMAQQTAELDAIFEVLNVPITVYDRQGEIVRTNAAARAVWGVAEDARQPINFQQVAALLSVRSASGEEVDPAALSARRARSGEAVTGEEYQITAPSGLRHDFEASELPLVVDGEINGAVSVWHDVTEHKRKDEQTAILLRELSHRSKNLLSVIESILRQSAKGGGSKEEFVRRFSERLRALANSHDLLAKHNSLCVSMTDLIFSQVGHHWEPGQRRISISGLGLRLKPDAAQMIGMALHELSTNAAKYGALSNQTGRVSISWMVDFEGASEPMFQLKWAERGGPPVTVPKRQGFGSTVIQRVTGQALKGSASLDYFPDGIVWVLRAPRSSVVDATHQDAARAERMRSPDLVRLQRVWTDRHRDGRPPRLADMTLDEIGRQDNLIIATVDREMTPPRVRFVSIGKALTERLALRGEGRENEFTEAEILGAEEGAYRRCIRSAKPAYEYAYFNLREGRSFFFERLLLPLSDDGETISHVIGMASFEDGLYGQSRN
jgi:PAS domain S-box-containing protein